MRNLPSYFKLSIYYLPCYFKFVIEVKSGKLRSMHLLLKENLNVKKGLVYGKIASGNEGQLDFRPIYSAGKI